MSVEVARKNLRRLVEEAESINRDSSLTLAQKAQRIESIHTEAKNFSSEIELANQARALLGGATSEKYTGPDNVGGGLSSSLLRAPARDYGWDGKSFGGPSVALSLEASKVITEAVRTKSITRVELGTKSALDVTTDIPARLNDVPISFLREPTRISSLMPVFDMPARVLEYLRVSGVTGVAEAVAPGGLKPELVPTVDTVEAIATKIAAHAGINDESLLDFTNANALMTDVVSRAVYDAENQQLLNGNGTAPNMLGILGTPGILTRTQVSGEDPFDTLRRADQDLRTGSSFCSATSYVMSPTTWTDISLIRNSIGDFIIGDAANDTVPLLWGKPVVVTTEIADDIVLAADFTIASGVGIKNGLTLETQSTGADFTTNVTRFRAEERIGLAIFRPTAISKITLTTPTGKMA